mmetsp:Transcript_49128/g.90643  ORF Transcript_49128/g.90643 Transcript_49128/m.90643 type:complete len:208 (+) Transcript_49128:506-1129(+)
MGLLRKESETIFLALSLAFVESSSKPRVVTSSSHALVVVLCCFRASNAPSQASTALFALISSSTSIATVVGCSALPCSSCFSCSSARFSSSSRAFSSNKRSKQSLATSQHTSMFCATFAAEVLLLESNLSILAYKPSLSCSAFSLHSSQSRQVSSTAGSTSAIRSTSSTRSFSRRSMKMRPTALVAFLSRNRLKTSISCLTIASKSS